MANDDIGGQHYHRMVGWPAYVAAMMLAIPLAGCSSTVSGEPSRTQSGTAADSRIKSIAQVLPDVTEVSKLLGSSMIVGYPSGKPYGPEDLADGYGSAPPDECLSVPAIHLRQTFAGVPVTATAAIAWRTTAPAETFPKPDLQVQVSVVELDSPASATIVYHNVNTNWRHCQNVPLAVHKMAGNDGLTFVFTMTRVTDRDGMLTSVVMLTTDTDNHPLPYQRAFVVAGRYAVEVQVTDTSSVSGDAVGVDQAVAVARMVTDRILSPS